MRLFRGLAVTIAVSAVALTATSISAQEWSPDRPINIIVPWGAGGATDQVTRVTAPILAEQLGTDVVVVNQPGGSGAVGTQGVLSAQPDGYTLLATGIADAATYAVTGLIEGTTIDDWHLYLSVANVSVISVPADSPYADFGELLAAFQEDGANITVATAGVSSAGGTALSTLAEAGDFDYNLVAYDGGGPATVATASGESMVTTQLAGEQAELIRGGRLRPLAVLSDEPLTMDGVDTIPPVTEWLPDIDIAYNYFGVLAPKGVPEEVVSTLDTIWAEHVATSEELQSYAQAAGALFTPAYGEEAREMVSPTVVAQACAALERGDAVNDPSTIGVDCEAGTETPVE
ncbi:tripartite tricarboxylate transporter substrate binding protein [Pelagibacterium sp. H642]|uniref:Bug family tripartite tricarboxylate transporter substrate binding protein n=1 Tax=Pelagibacterium sp. H642 TaxID=1881069 RepID=UPI0028156AA6|nr:tripartite tricarboxylate transporter substrate binding protein [Pelagibacterium sp. H642]WMT90199.1 tripartite tricarboxylate transporter substrate binding protein [Pelagibacterium sp. H642]